MACTPSTRRLLDGVAVRFSDRATCARPTHSLICAQAKMDSVFDDGSKTWATVTNKLYAQTAPCLILQDVVNPGKVSAASDGSDLCGNQNFTARFVLNRRVVLHAIDATPARWRGDAGSSPLDRARTAASSPGNDLLKTCWCT